MTVNCASTIATNTFILLAAFMHHILEVVFHSGKGSQDTFEANSMVLLI